MTSLIDLPFNRATLERQIVLSAKELQSDPSLPCEVNLEQLDKFVLAWWMLRDYYYENPADTVISIEVVRDYIHWDSLFGGWFNDDQANPECKQLILDAHLSMKHSMQEIITSVNRFLYPLGR